MLVIPLPSPTKEEPDARTTLPPDTNNPPVIEVSTLISNPRASDITAIAEPETSLSNSRSVSASAGILNNPLPSPSNRDAVTGTLTFNFSGSIIATPEPELILKSSRSIIDSGGMLNNPPPSPINNDAVIEPLTEMEPVN